MGGRPDDVEVESVEQEDRARLLPRLLRGTPEEVLARLTSDDPLRLEQECAKRIRERFYLLDPERVFERALSRVALMASKTPAEELSREWLLAQVDHSIQRVLEEESEEERRSPYDCDPEDPRYQMLREIFIEGCFARTASWAFNRLPERPRVAFHYLCLEQRSVDECLKLGVWDDDTLYEDIWRALAAPGYHVGEGRPDPEWQGGFRP